MRQKYSRERSALQVPFVSRGPRSATQTPQSREPPELRSQRPQYGIFPRQNSEPIFARRRFRVALSSWSSSCWSSLSRRLFLITITTLASYSQSCYAVSQSLADPTACRARAPSRPAPPSLSLGRRSVRRLRPRAGLNESELPTPRRVFAARVARSSPAPAASACALASIRLSRVLPNDTNLRSASARQTRARAAGCQWGAPSKGRYERAARDFS